MKNLIVLPSFKYDSKAFRSAWEYVLGIIRFDRKVLKSAAVDTKMGFYALVGIVAGALSVSLATFFLLPLWGGGMMRFYLSGMFFGFFYQVLIFVLGLIVMAFVAKKLFKGQVDFPGFFRVMGLAYFVYAILLVTLIFPFLFGILTFLLNIWLFAFCFFAIRTLFGLSNVNTLLTILVSAVGLYFVGMILAMFNVFSGAGGFHMMYY